MQILVITEITVAIAVSWWHQVLGCWKARLDFSEADVLGYVHIDCVPRVFSGVMAEGRSPEDIFVDTAGNCP